MQSITEQDRQFMRRAIELAGESGERPFGAVVVKEGQVVAEAKDEVNGLNDPTAHAEMVALRQAAERLQSPTLSGCRLYTVCEPCPMCLGAIYWASLEAVFYTNTQIDLKPLRLDDAFIYREMNQSYADRSILFVQIPDPLGLEMLSRLADSE